jgi:hypothetical protein
VTSAAFLERLAELLGDVPTRLALAGLTGCLGASVGLIWWTSRHYAARLATGCGLTTWEKAMEAKSQSREPQPENEDEACGREAEVASDAR